MFPESGSGVIHTERPLVPDLNTEEFFICPDALFPHAEKALQYHLISLLKEHGSISPEMRLSDGTDAIDLVWIDKENSRRVGIETKTISGLERSNTSEQINRYQDITLADTLDKETILIDGSIRQAEEFFTLDEVWVASYKYPRPRNSHYESDPELASLVPEADGWLIFDMFTGELSYEIDSTSNREGLWRRTIQQVVEYSEPEAPLVADLWHDLKCEGFSVTAESWFSNAPSARSIDGHVQYDPRLRADLVIDEGPVDGFENELTAIEVKPKFEVGSEADAVINQLSQYIDSKMFSKVYLALPCTMIASKFRPTVKPGFDTLTSRGSMAEYVVDRVPETGIISIHRDSFHGDTDIGYCEYESYQVLEQERFQPEKITTEKVPYLVHNPRHGYAWQWETDIASNFS